MDDLVQWLGEQLDEDERIARATSGEEWGVVSPTQPYVIFDVAAYRANKTLATVGAVAAVERAEDRAHIAAHDPARVLREIDSKRRILGECAYWGDKLRQEAANRPKCPQPGLGERLEVATPILRLLALPYADRPGYREEWRP